MRLLPNLYCYIWQGMGNNCNSYLITGKTLTLIDPGHIVNEYGEPCLERLAKSMKTDGYNINDIERIIITHEHPDHFESASAINKGKAKIVMYQNTNNYNKLARGPIGKIIGLKPMEFKPDSFVKDGDVLDLGGVSLNIIYSPGHSPESMCLYWAEAKVLLTGDVIFMMSIGRTDFPGGDIALLEQSIARLSKLDVEYLLPGHMDIVIGKSEVQRNFAIVRKSFFG